MKNYSQNKEQDIILAYFQDHKGTFLDLGANDGITFSNTRALAELGWKGVLVDASPRAFDRLKELYRGQEGFSVYHLALACHDGKVVLNESGPLVSADDVALVSTLNDQEKERFAGATRYQTVTVPCFTWKTFLDASPVKHFDFISMDIEGSELDVLPHMDLSQTKLICIEHNGREVIRREYEKYLDGFDVVYESGENLIYARK